MKKKTIVKVFKTINKICLSYDNCGLCIFKNNCPYSAMVMTYDDNVSIVANYIKNTVDKEKQNNGTN